MIRLFSSLLYLDIKTAPFLLVVSNFWGAVQEDLYISIVKEEEPHEVQ